MTEDWSVRSLTWIVVGGDRDDRGLEGEEPNLDCCRRRQR